MKNIFEYAGHSTSGFPANITVERTPSGFKFVISTNALSGTVNTAHLHLPWKEAVRLGGAINNSICGGEDD